MKQKLFDLVNGKIRIRFVLSALFALLLPATLFGFLYVLNENDYFLVSNVAIEFENSGLSNRTPFVKLEDLAEDIRQLKGIHFWSINQEQISNIILSYPWVSEFYFSKSWPNAIQIKIQLSPLLFLSKDKNMFTPYFLNGKWGKPSRVWDQSEQIPIFEYSVKNLKPDSEILSQLVQLFELSKELKILNPSNIRYIQYSEQKGFTAFLRAPNTQVLLGSQLSSDSLVRVTRVLEYLESHKIEARVIDSNFTKKVLVRLRNQL